MTAVDEVDEVKAEAAERFSTVRVCELTGASYRQLDRWRAWGLLDRDDARGSGSHREFSMHELQTVYYAVGLIDAGFTMRAALDVAKVIAADGCVDVTVAEIVRVRVGVRVEAGA